MLHLIQCRRALLDDAVLRSMFAARKRVFVDLLGWDIPVLAGVYEVDQFDTSEAIYLVITDAAGHHRASARLLATTVPHILDTMFSSLCAGPVPRGPTIFEITRFCLDRRLTANERRNARDELITALVAYGLHAGITRYTGVATPGWIEQVMGFGWQVHLLGPRREIGGLSLGALAIDIDTTTPALLRCTGVIETCNLAAELADVA